MANATNENDNPSEQMVTVKEDSENGKTLIDHGQDDSLVINEGRTDTEISSTSATDTDISSTWETDVELNAPWFQPPWYRPPIPVTKPLLTSTGVVEEVQLDIINSLQRDVETRLNKVAETSQRIDGIDRGLQKLYNEGIKNTANTVTVVAVLIATVTFTALFTVPGGWKSNGEAVMIESPTFIIFLITDTVALFSSLVIVLILVTVVPFKKKIVKKLLFYMNKVMWLAIACTASSFLSAIYFMIGSKHKAVAVTLCLIGGCTIAFTLGILFFLVAKHQLQKGRKRRTNGIGVNPSIDSDFTNGIGVNLSIDSDFVHSRHSGFHPV